MPQLLKVRSIIIIGLGILLAGCAVAPTAVLPEQAATPEASTFTVYAPASTSSIPVIIAAQKLANVKLVLYTDQSQANTLFLRGEAPLLVTGLSVGMDLYRNEAPVKAVNTYVNGLSYLVTYGKPVSSFAELKGQQIYIPFEGSPIEQATAYLAGVEGLAWKADLQPIYSPFDASVALLKQGKLSAVVLPEPNVSLVENQPDVYISLNFYDAWNKANPGASGYPQVGTFVNTEWAKTHSAEIAAFNQALTEAILQVQQDPAAAVETVKASYKLPAEILLKSLSRTRYQMISGAEMQQAIETYYRVIGKPLDETIKGFYYTAGQ